MDTNELGITIGLIILGICLNAWIFSLFFQVKNQLWNQQKQLDILAELALKSGVTQQELQEIIDRKV